MSRIREADLGSPPPRRRSLNAAVCDSPSVNEAGVVEAWKSKKPLPESGEAAEGPGEGPTPTFPR